MIRSSRGSRRMVGSFDQVSTWVLGVGLGIALAALSIVGLLSWGRTRDLRCGRAEAAPSPVTAAISATTMIASASGVILIGLGCLQARSRHVTGPALAAAGILVAWTGWTARVARISADPDGLSVRYARRARFHAPWNEILELRRPRWPLGGWTIRTASGHRTTLMPSDLLGNEGALGAIVARAALRFERGRWIRGP